MISDNTKNKIKDFPNKVGFFPNLEQVESLELEQVINLNLKSIIDSHSTPSKKFNFKLVPPPEGILIDVTHTFSYPYHSGIQRVVRSFVVALNEIGHKTVLFRFDLTHGQPVLLSEVESKQFYNWQEFVTLGGGVFGSPNHSPIPRLINIIKPFKKFIPTSIWDFARNTALKIKTYRFQKVSSKTFEVENINVNVLDLRDQKVVLPEVTSELPRIQMIQNLSKWFNVNFIAIVYDLIPLTHPEYCTIGYDFIHYIQLFRSINKAVCISKHTASEVSSLLAITPRTVSSDLQISSLYLGGDFTEIKNAKLDLNIEYSKFNSDEKVILMIARFEPRKNIRRVAQAMAQLQIKGQKFKFVIVGNPGWKQELIFNDIEQYKKSGLNIEYHLKLPDSELFKWYNKAYFTIFCSIVEGLGLPVIESVLFKKPCITANSGSQAEIADLLGGCIKVNPYSVDSIKNAAENLLNDPILYKSLKDQTEKATWPTWNDYAKEFVELHLN